MTTWLDTRTQVTYERVSQRRETKAGRYQRKKKHPNKTDNCKPEMKTQVTNRNIV